MDLTLINYSFLENDGREKLAQLIKAPSGIVAKGTTNRIGIAFPRTITGSDNTFIVSFSEPGRSMAEKARAIIVASALIRISL